MLASECAVIPFESFISKVMTIPVVMPAGNCILDAFVTSSTLTITSGVPAFLIAIEYGGVPPVI